VVETVEVSLVGLGEITVCVVGPSGNEPGERANTVRSAAFSAGGEVVAGASDINPADGIEPMCLAV
jgi:hypothetical protein